MKGLDVSKITFKTPRGLQSFRSRPGPGHMSYTGVWKYLWLIPCSPQDTCPWYLDIPGTHG